MRVAILHHNLEWSEEELERISIKNGHETKRFDIRETDLKKIIDFNPDLILNRVYASVGNYDYASSKKTLKLLEKLNDRNFLIVNSFEATKTDYDKYYAYTLMLKAGISTPKTIIYNSNINTSEYIENLGGFPLIVKRNTGGKGMDIKKCLNENEFNNAIKNIQNSENYGGKIIIQEFIEPIEPNDYRVWVIGGKAAFYHKRSLISLGDENPWIASSSLGSKILPPEKDFPIELKVFAEKAAKSVNSDLDCLDIVKTSKGYEVIEHNPTPSMKSKYKDILGFHITDNFLEIIFKKYFN